MSWELPPLGAIRVFEAAARLGSFTKAAEELGMTQSAASYQIKVLEERAGTPLFIRKTRQIALTDAGQQLAPHATGGFSTLADAWVATKGGATGVLSVTTMETFASNWLAVWLGTFQLMHPDLAVKVNTSSRLVDFTREDMDIGIRTGTGKWPVWHYLFKTDHTEPQSRLAERRRHPCLGSLGSTGGPTIPGGELVQAAGVPFRLIASSGSGAGTGLRCDGGADRSVAAI